MNAPDHLYEYPNDSYKLPSGLAVARELMMP